MMGICECGCGTEVNNRFIHGHSRRGKHLSEEHKKKFIQKGENHPQWGKPRSKEIKLKLREANIGKHHSTEIKLKMSEAQKGDKHSQWGTHRSNETKLKLSEANKGKHHSKETRKKISESNIIRYAANPDIKRRMSLNRKGKLRPDLKGKSTWLTYNRKYQIFPFKDTSIEIALQNKLKEAGIVFRMHEPITGQPDIFIEPNICIFADGCYWHGCNQCFNQNKFNDRQRVDIVKREIVTKKLQNDGCIVLRFWEHEIKKDVDYCMSQIKTVLPAKTENIVVVAR